MRFKSMLGVAVFAVAVVALAAQQASVETRPPNAAGQKPAFPGQTRAPEQKSNVAYELVTVAEGLVSPWAIAFLPEGKMLVTEKAGRLRVVTPDGKLSEPVAGLPPQDARGQGGLLDVVVDPELRHHSADLLELRRTAGRSHQQHGGGAWPFCGRRDGATGGERAGDLPPGAVDDVDGALRQPPRVRARWHALRNDGRSIVSARSHAGPEPGCADRQDRANQCRRVRSRRTTRLSARTACGRKSGRTATATSRARRSTRRPGSCGKSNMAPAAAMS